MTVFRVFPAILNLGLEIRCRPDDWGELGEENCALDCFICERCNLADEPTKKTRAGRPTAEQALRKALEPFRAIGIDHHTTVNPLDVMALLAVDPSVSPETRLAAAIALHDRKNGARDDPAAGKTDAVSDLKPGPVPAPADPGIPDDEITRRAMQILKTGTSR